MYLTSEKSIVRIAEFSTQWEGRTIEGGYPLRQFLGAGESSVVYLTSHEGRNAAIKLIPGDPRKAYAHLSRLRESAKLSHPHLMRIFSSGRCELDGVSLLYIVMERAEEDLSQVLPDRPLTANETREMLAPTLSALEYLHGQGAVHAHLKPSNIMAVEDQLKISSDGLNERGPASPYDPPEQTPSPAGDVWSLGVTLVEVLTQHLPVNGTVPAGLPEPFADIARRCLAQNPEDRPAIPKIAGMLAVEATPVAPHRRRIAPIGVWILLALIVITVAGVIFMHSETGASAPVKATEVTKTAEPLAAPVPTPVREVRPAAKVSKPAPAQPEAKSEPVKAEPVPETPTTAPASGIIAQPLPEITSQARNTIHGRVKFTIRVDVTPSGSVSDAKLDSADSSKYFGERALAAVRQWKFEPVVVNGSEVGQRWRVRFEFLKSGTKVQPQRISP